MDGITIPPARKVGHLTLLREPRHISEAEFNALGSTERLEIIRAAEDKLKYDLLLSAEDNRKLIARIPAQELFLLIRERGLVDAEELVGLVTAEQFNLFTDFDCWDDEQVSGDRVLPWLATLLSHEEDDILRILREMDFDFLTIIVQKYVKVIHGPEYFTDEEELKEAVARDGGYEVHFKNEDCEKLFGLLFAKLFHLDQTFLARLLEASRGEIMAELEEECFRRRNNRLADLGFPDPIEARKIYQKINPDKFNRADWEKGEIFPPDDDLIAPSFALATMATNNQLTRALKETISPELSWELSYLLNKVLSAAAVDIGDFAAISNQSVVVRNYLNIGLEQCSHGDDDSAAAILESTYLQALFQLGYSLCAKLTDRAERLAQTVIKPYLDEPFQQFLHGLRQSPPRLQVPDENGTSKERDVASLEDLSLANSRLDRLDMLNELFGGALPFTVPIVIDLNGCVPDTQSELTLGQLLLTALGNQLLGKDFAPTPLDERRLAELHARLGVAGVVSETIRGEFCSMLDTVVSGAGTYAQYLMEMLEDDFLAIDPDDLDPRYISSLLIRLT